MALWDRFKNFINEHIRESPGFQEQPPVAPILPDEPLGGQYDFPVENPIYGANPFPVDTPNYNAYESSDLITIIDDYGVYHGEMTFQDWWEASLLTSEQFHARFGFDFYNVELIYLLEEELDIDWDWATWRETYASVFA